MYSKNSCVYRRWQLYEIMGTYALPRWLLRMQSHLKDKKVGPNTRKQPEDPHSTSGSTGCFQAYSSPRLPARECDSHDAGIYWKGTDPCDVRWHKFLLQWHFLWRLKWPRHQWLLLGIKSGEKMLFTNRTMHFPQNWYSALPPHLRKSKNPSLWVKDKN